MGQQYLSTDPNAGQNEQKYLSTDPNAGGERKSGGLTLTSLITGEQPKKRTRADITDDMPGDEVAQILIESDPLMSSIAQGINSGGLGPAGLTKVAAEPARRFIHRIAKVVMDKALGSQSPVRNRFPGVDLAEQALKHGTNPEKVAAAGQAAAREVVAAGQASTAAPIRPSEVMAGIRPVYERAAKAVRGGVSGAMEPVRATVREIRKIPRTGVSMDDALVAKSEWQEMGKAAQRALPGQLAGPNARSANAVGKQFARVIRGRGDQRVNDALDNSQGIMALQQAVKAMSNRPSLLQLVLGTTAGGATGAMTGDWDKAAMAALTPLAFSPRGLSAMAQGVQAAEPAVAPLLEGVYRSLMAGSNPDGRSSR